MPSISSKTYQNYVDYIFNTMNTHYHSMMEKAHQTIKNYYRQLGREMRCLV